MTKVDSRILGFNVSSAADHWNVEKNSESNS